MDLFASVGKLFRFSLSGVFRSVLCKVILQKFQEGLMNSKKNKTNIKEVDADVLYQKLGDRWFAFSLIGDEVFMSPVTDEIINGIKAENQNTARNPDETV
jgi:hypothetical protein